MARLIPAKCPTCGADVRIDAARDVVVCAYCQTTSFIERPNHPAPPNTTMPIVRVEAKASPVALLAVLGGVVIVGAVAAVALSRSPGRSSADSGPAGPPPAKRPDVAAPVAPSVLDARPLLADLDDQQPPALVLRLRRPGQDVVHAAVRSGSGEIAWETKIRGAAHSLRTTVAAGRLFAADDAGQITAYLVTTGKEQWTTSLGEKLAAFCGGATDGVRVRTEDGKLVDLAAKTGGQSPVTGGACGRIAAAGREPPADARDRTDPEAPPGVEGTQCGSVRVTGSQSYFVPDACAALGVAYEGVDGLTANRVWKHGDGYLAFGTKRPGTRVPTVAFARPRSPRPVWIEDVPPGNPLQAVASPPTAATLVGPTLVVGFGLQSGDGGVTAFAAADGKRLWTQPFDKRAVASVVAVGDGVAVLLRDELQVLDASSGKVRFRIGPSS